MIVCAHFGQAFTSSDVGPAFVGFLGGLVLGSVLSNAQPAPPPPPVYEYYDPYCRERFSSRDAYQRHLEWYDHPARIEVLEVHSGRCVDTYDWRDGRWRSERDDRYGYDDGRGDDPGRGYEQDRGDGQ